MENRWARPSAIKAVISSLGRLKNEQTESTTEPINNPLAERMHLLSDQQWLDLLIRSVQEREIDGVRFPGFPADAVQMDCIGSANETALRHAFAFYSVVKQYALTLGMPIGADRRFLDFGMGWGRFLRFFWKDVSLQNLFGCDINPDFIQIARDLGVPGNFDRLYAFGKLPYADGYMQGAMAYSVFTHLSEPVHRHWMLELARVLQPGAIFTLTVSSRRFVDALEAVPDETGSGYQWALHAYAARAEEFRSSYDRGDFVYLPTGGGAFRGPEDYGDALVPRSYLEAHWAPYFAIREYIDDPSRFWQAVVIAQRI